MKKVYFFILTAIFWNNIVCAENNAKFIAQTVQTVVSPGQRFPVSIVYQNTGSNTWFDNGEKSWWLGSENPRDNFIWGSNRGGKVDKPVGPTFFFPFNFSVTAPSVPGSYNFQWQMLQNYVEWFGEKTPNVRITVGTPEYKGTVSTYIREYQLKTIKVQFYIENTGNFDFNNKVFLWTSNGDKISLSILRGERKDIYLYFTPPNYGGPSVVETQLRDANGRGVSDKISIFLDHLKLSSDNKQEVLPSAQIFPNPATDIVNVQISNPKKKSIVQLFNAEGKIVLSRSYKATQLIKLNISDLEKGIYIISIENGSKLMKRKIVVK